MSNAMSLKAKIRNIAKAKNIPAQVILQNYLFERLLVRLAQSEHLDKFVLKGGMLVAAIVGLQHRNHSGRKGGNDPASDCFQYPSQRLL